MLTSRLLSNFKIFSEISLISSFSSSGKYNVIKVLNTGNKYLYGDLLETQKQRRRKITKTAENESKGENGRPSETKSDELATKNKIEDDPGTGKKSTKSRISKPKASNTGSHIVDDSKSSDEHEARLDFSSDQFVFNSATPICVQNYPIRNQEKNELYSQSCMIKNIYNYTFNDPRVKTSLKFPSVSKIIEDTMSDKNKQILERWRQNMIKEMGEEGFYKQNEASKARGQEFHAAVLRRVLGEEVGECSEVTRNALASLGWMLDQVSHPMAVESVIAHPSLGYKGVFDCAALFRNIPVVIDWKLSDKPKKDLKDTYDAPVQVTAYIGAMNHDPNYEWAVDHGLVAVAYTNGDPCDVFLLAPKHCQIYWKHWLLRLDKFKARSHLHLDHDIDEKALQLT